eukprot:9698932-Lingulodinium_polyedra.AAC.1
MEPPAGRRTARGTKVWAVKVTTTTLSICVRSAGTPWTMRTPRSLSTSGRDAGISYIGLVSRPCAGARSSC